MVCELNIAPGPRMHLYLMGSVHELPVAELGILASAADRQILLAAAEYLGLPAGELRGCRIDRHPDGDITLRPTCVFG